MGSNKCLLLYQYNAGTENVALADKTFVSSTTEVENSSSITCFLPWVDGHFEIIIRIIKLLNPSGPRQAIGISLCFTVITTHETHIYGMG